jgi:hypothetical protein
LIPSNAHHSTFARTRSGHSTTDDGTWGVLHDAPSELRKCPAEPAMGPSSRHLPCCAGRHAHQTALWVICSKVSKESKGFRDFGREKYRTSDSTLLRYETVATLFVSMKSLVSLQTPVKTSPEESLGEGRRCFTKFRAPARA